MRRTRCHGKAPRVGACISTTRKPANSSLSTSASGKVTRPSRMTRTTPSLFLAQGGLGWFKTRVWDETHDAAKAQGWCAPILDYNGDGKTGPSSPCTTQPVIPSLTTLAPTAVTEWRLVPSIAAFGIRLLSRICRRKSFAPRPVPILLLPAPLKFTSPRSTIPNSPARCTTRREASTLIPRLRLDRSCRQRRTCQL